MPLPKKTKLDVDYIMLKDETKLSETVATLSKYYPEISTATKWQVDRKNASDEVSIKSLVAMFAIVYLLCLFSVYQKLVSSINERRNEFKLMRSLGASSGNIISSIMIETVILVVAAAILLAVSAVLTHFSSWAMLQKLDAGQYATFPVMLVCGLVVIQLITMLDVSLIACLKHIKQNN